MDIHQLLLALIEGAGLILSPCILPVLPIVLGTAVDGGRRRPLGIITGFIIAFTLFALVSRQAVLASNVDAGALRHASLLLLILLGMIMLVPPLSDWLSRKLEGVARLGAQLMEHPGATSSTGFFGGLVVGALIGLVWTPCAGPILAAAVIQVIQAESTVQSALILAIFATGAGLPMLAIALFGRGLLQRLSFLKRHAAHIRQVFGAVIIALSVLIYTGADVRWLASLPGTEKSRAADIAADAKGLRHALDNPYPAPEITGIEGWINSAPLTMAGLKGKVVLVDFWTYSCINCVRTLPYVTAWYDKYKDDGFVVLGLHAPEFAFERRRSNVEDAVKSHGIRYPVALDNMLRTWRNFENRYWPAHYLIDRDGRVVYTHFGEGNYDVTEANIRALLGVDGDNIAAPHDDAGVRGQSPETYLGFERAAHFAGQLSAGNNTEYAFADTLDLHSWSLSGGWRSDREYIESTTPQAGLRYRFYGAKVFLVMGSADGRPVTVKVDVDGAEQPDITVDRQTIYKVIDLPRPQDGLLELRADRPGLQAYAFTFGG